jgi:hypothetical protein
MLKKCTSHLDEVHESYGEHMCFAMEISWLMLSGAVMIFLHALIPGIFVRNGSQRINLMAKKIRSRQNDPTIQDFVI